MTLALLDGDIIAFKSAIAVVDGKDELSPVIPENAEKLSLIHI